MANIVNTVLTQATENISTNTQNATERTPSTPEGMAVAYGSLVIMALLPIFFGSYRSVVYHKEKVGFRYDVNISSSELKNSQYIINPFYSRNQKR